MKKILTASLVAMMAVSAARAEIASTTYVTNKVSTAQNTLQGNIDTVAGNLANEVTRATGVEGGFKTRIEALEAATGDGEGSVLADAKAYADQAEADAIAAAAEAAKIYIDETELNASQTAQDTTLKAYADDAAGAVSTALTNYQTTNDAAVKKVGDDLAAETLRATGVEGGFKTRIEALEAATGDGEGSVLADAKAYADQAEADAIAAAAEAAKIYIDETELNASQTAQDTTLKAYADDAAGAVSTALTNYQTTNDAAVKKVGDDLAAEVTARTTADTGLSGRIAELEAASGENGATTQKIAAAQAAADKAQGEVDALENVVDGKQTKSSELSLGSAAGAWQTLASINGYSTNCGTGKTCALSNVDGNISWVAVVNQ